MFFPIQIPNSFQHHFLKRLTFAHWIAFMSLLKISASYITGFISFLSSLFLCNICLSLWQFHIILINVVLWVLKSLFFLEKYFGYLRSFIFLEHFRISLYISVLKNLLGFWVRLHWIYRSIWGELTFKILSFPIYEHNRSLFFHFSLQCL